MFTTTTAISRMTCQHCIDAVREELQSLNGVESVQIQLNPGGVSTAEIRSTQELNPEEIGEAVAEAGYLVISNDA